MVLRFENPEYLWGLAGVVLFAGLMLWQGRRKPGTFSGRRFAFTSLALAACVVGLARPQRGERVSTPQSVASSVILMVDISRSMLAQDLTPSRLGFAVEFSRKLLPLLKNSRVALFPFALDGFVQMPFTNDVDAISDMLGSLSPSMTTAQGTDLTDSLDKVLTFALRAEKATKDRGGDWVPVRVLLVSDGESHYPLNDGVIKGFRTAGIPIFSVGTGTAAGGTIPADLRFTNSVEGTGWQGGRQVLTKLNAENLKKISQQTGGEYFTGRFEDVTLAAQKLNQSLQFARLQSSFKLQQEYFPYLFALALLLLVGELACGRWELVFRAAAVGLPLLLAPNAHAADRAAEATKKYNEGTQKLQAKDMKGAAEKFDEAALMSNDPNVRKKALYNLGNVMLKSGEPSQALQVYQQAFDIELGSEKAQAALNQKITENMMLAARVEQQMQQQAQKQPGDDGEEGKDKSPDNDQKGPKKFQAQQFSESQKKQIWDLLSNEEQQTLNRIRGEKNRGQGERRVEKPW